MGILIARDLQRNLQELESALQPLHDELEELALRLLQQRVSPEEVWEFERALQERLRGSPIDVPAKHDLTLTATCWRGFAAPIRQSREFFADT